MGPADDDTTALNSIPEDISTTDEIDSAIGALTNHVRKVVEKSEWEVPASLEHRKLLADVLELMRSKDAPLRRPSVYPTTKYRSRARAFQHRVRARVQDVLNENWKDLIKEITPTYKTEGIEYLLLKPNNIVALGDAEIAECLADRIECQCSHAYPLHDAHSQRIDEEIQNKTSLELKDNLPSVSLSEVQTLIKSLKIKNATGLDSISNKAIKCFHLPLLGLLVAIYNTCLKNCYFPLIWKKVKVIGIHKPGKPRDLPTNYKPISLLSGLGKFFGKILKFCLSDHLLGKGIVIDEQFGFRSADACLQQVL
ncbi:Probable RNA-directed DNA polymerase from transposon BS [Eumeta japonica]|uniref:Probable RNA-directed DNA polymerase from transposon BS n=1 Tax=Eumeta variegata TaxID=151549 RepID=A0A4C1SE53_EUMVA|nr:Probable RNA-directed DNA polymerase from transposon BS [Eumeta japonica]